MVPVEFAETYSPAQCRELRDRSMALARLARRPRGDEYYRVNQEIVVDAVRRARHFNRVAIAGGNEAYRFRLANARQIA